MTKAFSPYRGFRLLAEVIEHAVWPHHPFSLSLRDVETILAAHGMVVSYENIREREPHFGRLFGNTLKHLAARDAAFQVGRDVTDSAAIR